MYLIKLSISESSVQVISVDDISEVALLNNSFFQWYVMHAHLLNAPLDTDIARDHFLCHNPAQVSKIAFDAPLFLNINDKSVQENKADEGI